MFGTAMRGADALPGSKATSRAKGSHRNLGDLASGRQELRERDGPHREGEEPKPMMHGPEKSDLVIVAMKPANKAKEPTAEASARANAAEPVERRAGAEGNAHRQSTHWTQRQARVSQALAHNGKHLPSHTRGGSRMRESRTYGSGRGACDESHVPTATQAARVHHARSRLRCASNAASIAAGSSTRRSSPSIASSALRPPNAMQRGSPLSREPRLHA
jgi:hypothetical protein